MNSDNNSQHQNGHIVSIFEHGSDNLKVDSRNGDLYWCGQRVKTTGKIKLEWPERIIGAIIAIVTIISLSISGYKDITEISTKKAANKPATKTAVYDCQQISETNRKCTIVYSQAIYDNP